MSPHIFSAAFLAHILPPKHPPLKPDQGEDPEKGAPGHASDNNDGDDLDDLEEQEDIEMDEDERRGGVPLSSTGTMSSSSMSNGFPRRSASLPDWLVKIKEFIFGSHQDHDELSLPTYRRTPLISGSLIPFSILLEIPGLTEHWYVRTYGLQIVETRRNPALVNVSLTFSMALAVIANIALIYRFLERSVKRSTIICIFALTLHDLLNIVTIVTFGIQHRFNDGFTTGEAFWMTICSTIVSTITNLTLIWDLRKTPNFAEAGSGITRKQRSLVIITIIFLAYIALGALFSSLAMSLTFLDGLFFTLVTTLTIGFGDIVPKTATQRVVVCLYAVFGIIILGSGVRLTSEAVLEGLQVGYRRRLKEYKMRRKARKHEREQVRRWRAAVEECLVERGLEVWTPDKPVLASSGPNTRPTTLRRGSNFVSQPMYLNTEALPRVVLESAAREAGVPPERFIGRKFGRRARQTYRRHHHYDQQRRQDEPEGDRRGRVPMDITWTIDDGGLQEHRNGNWSSAWWERARHALHLANAGDASSVPQGDPFPSMTAQEMIKDIERDERRSLYTKLGFAWAVFFTFWLIGSVIFSKTENWGYGSAMYFCFIAFTTIGYGDLAPKTALGRSIFVVWALFGVGAMTILIAVVSDAFSSKYHSVMHDKRFDRAVRRYRQGQEKAMRGQVKEDSNRSASAQVMPVLQANLARISSREPGQPTIVSEPAQTLEEAEARLRARIEPLPAMILKEVLRLRDHTRYFLVSNGHASAWNLHTVPGANDVLTTSRAVIPEDLKEVLDEIAREEGFEERLKQEVWDDPHARNTLFLLSLEKGARKMVEAAELALETLAERNELRVLEERVDEEEIE